MALVRRERGTIVPDGDTRLEDGDYLTVIGDPDVIEKITDRYGRRPGEAREPGV